MELVAIVEDSWGWTGLIPDQVVGDNDFGNLMIRDRSGRYWRLCPEDLYCEIIATSKTEFDELSRSQEFLHDWHMAALVQQARKYFGPLRPGYKYCLKIPGTLGGEYGGGNLATIALGELISASGHIAHQIKDFPDRGRVKLNIVE